MGASTWHYVVPYNEDPNEALRQLRDEVFASGKYGDPFAAGDTWSYFWKLPPALKLLVLAAKTYSSVAAAFRFAARGFRRPQSIAEAIELAAESGTHSILDIERCGPRPDFGVAAPLSPAQQRRFFGTDHPSEADLERVGWSEPAEDMERWHAIYFPLYNGDVPVKLVFVGCSGD